MTENLGLEFRGCSRDRILKSQNVSTDYHIKVILVSNLAFASTSEGSQSTVHGLMKHSAKRRLVHKKYKRCPIQRENPRKGRQCLPLLVLIMFRKSNGSFRWKFRKIGNLMAFNLLAMG